MFKKIVVSALAFTFALAVALPASALDREERGRNKDPRGHGAPQVTSSQAKVSIAGHGRADQLRFSQRQSSSQGRPDFFQKAECTFTCGDWIVTCYGSSASCEDESGCTASGGGKTIEVICVN